MSSSILLPGQEISLSIDKDEGSEIFVEPGAHSTTNWPGSQMRTVVNGKIHLRNDSFNPIHLGRDIKNCQIRDTEVFKNSREDSKYYNHNSTKPKKENDKISQVDLKGVTSKEAMNNIRKAHFEFNEVFNEDLSQGYNDFFGKHKCKLNWATKERPLGQF